MKKVQTLSIRHHRVDAVELLDKGSRIDIPRGTKMASATVSIEDNPISFTEQLARELVCEGYTRAFGPIDWRDVTLTFTYLSMQIVAELRVVP